MQRILFDLNVILDVLLDRPPHAAASAELWALVETGQCQGLIAAHCVTTLHYLSRRAGGPTFASQCTADVLSVFAVAPVDEQVLRAAHAMEWADFEDAVCASAARAAGCTLIATRDEGGFRRAEVRALDPHAAAAVVRGG